MLHGTAPRFLLELIDLEDIAHHAPSQIRPTVVVVPALYGKESHVVAKPCSSTYVHVPSRLPNHQTSYADNAGLIGGFRDVDA